MLVTECFPAAAHTTCPSPGGAKELNGESMGNIDASGGRWKRNFGKRKLVYVFRSGRDRRRGAYMKP